MTFSVNPNYPKLLSSILRKAKRLFFRLKGSLSNLSVYLFATFLTSSIGIAINPLLAINLSPEDYAIIGYFNSFNVLILPIISFSFLSYYSRNYYRVIEEERGEILDTLLMGQLVLGIISLSIVCLGFYFYMQISKVEFAFFPFALMSFSYVFFHSFYSFLLVQKRMERQAKSYLKIVLSSALLNAISAMLFVVALKWGALGRFTSVLLPALIIGIYSLRRLTVRIRMNKEILVDALKFGWPLSLSSIMFYFLSGVDRAFLEQLNQTNEFGIYNVAIQISTYLYVFYTAISQTFEPDIFQNINNNNTRGLFKIILGILLLNLLPTVLFIVFAKPIIGILTFNRYVDSTVYAQILAIKTIPMALCFFTSKVIVGYGYPKAELINKAIGAIISIILFKILIGRYGFFGAAWGQTLSFLIMGFISVLFLGWKKLVKKQLG